MKAWGAFVNCIYCNDITLALRGLVIITNDTIKGLKWLKVSMMPKFPARSGNTNCRSAGGFARAFRKPKKPLETLVEKNTIPLGRVPRHRESVAIIMPILIISNRRMGSNLRGANLWHEVM